MTLGRQSLNRRKFDLVAVTCPRNVLANDGALDGGLPQTALSFRPDMRWGDVYGWQVMAATPAERHSWHMGTGRGAGGPS